MSSNRSHPVIDYLYEEIIKIPKDKRITTEIQLDGRLYISALIKIEKKYEEYKLPNTEEEVKLYWLDDKYDDAEESGRILHHYKSGLVLVYDNGIRSVGYHGESTYEKDVEDTLYIKVNNVPILEKQFSTINKEVEHITPHVDAITANTCNVVPSSGITEIVSSRVLGYKVMDVDTVISPLKSDWRSHQLIGNLLEYENTV